MAASPQPTHPLSALGGWQETVLVASQVLMRPEALCLAPPAVELPTLTQLGCTRPGLLFLCSFLRRSVKCGHKRRHRRGSETKFFILTGPRDGRYRWPCSATWGRRQGGQAAEDRSESSQSLDWGFCRKARLRTS